MLEIRFLCVYINKQLEKQKLKEGDTCIYFYLKHINFIFKKAYKMMRFFIQLIRIKSM